MFAPCDPGFSLIRVDYPDGGHTEAECVVQPGLDSVPAVLGRENFDPEQWRMLSDFIVVISLQHTDVRYSDTTRSHLEPLLRQGSKSPLSFLCGAGAADISSLYLLLVLITIGVPSKPNCSRRRLIKNLSSEKCILSALSVKTTKVGGLTEACVR